ncbi:hypothetical protein THAOC_14862, partial [Thalassiosira oceanica]
PTVSARTARVVEVDSRLRSEESTAFSPAARHERLNIAEAIPWRRLRSGPVIIAKGAKRCLGEACFVSYGRKRARAAHSGKERPAFHPPPAGQFPSGALARNTHQILVHSTDPQMHAYTSCPRDIADSKVPGRKKLDGLESRRSVVRTARLAVRTATRFEPIKLYLRFLTNKIDGFKSRYSGGPLAAALASSWGCKAWVRVRPAGCGPAAVRLRDRQPLMLAGPQQDSNPSSFFQMAVVGRFARALDGAAASPEKKCTIDEYTYALGDRPSLPLRNRRYRLSANAEVHHQSYERQKLRRDGDRSEGDAIIGELLSEGHVLIPFAVDGYGGLGPMARRFLFGDRPRRALTFRQDRPNATRMYARASAPPAPHAVVTLASIRWKQNQTRAFYGHSYTAPTPHEHLLQQLGLCFTKAFAIHIRNSKASLKSNDEAERDLSNGLDSSVRPIGPIWPEIPVHNTEAKRRRQQTPGLKRSMNFVIITPSGDERSLNAFKEHYKSAKATTCVKQKIRDDALF